MDPIPLHAAYLAVMPQGELLQLPYIQRLQHKLAAGARCKDRCCGGCQGCRTRAARTAMQVDVHTTVRAGISHVAGVDDELVLLALACSRPELGVAPKSIVLNSNPEFSTSGHFWGKRGKMLNLAPSRNSNGSGAGGHTWLQHSGQAMCLIQPRLCKEVVRLVRAAVANLDPLHKPALHKKESLFDGCAALHATISFARKAFECSIDIKEDMHMPWQ